MGAMRGLLLRHLLLELSGCERGLLDDVDAVRAALREAARLAGTRVLAEALHHFEPHGVTGVALLAESHVAIHTWPERGVAACDLLTCREGDGDGDLDRVASALRAAFGAARIAARVVERRP
jgi:S-adenosylmethionine decarboxylase